MELFLRCAADQQGAADTASAADAGAECGRTAQSGDARFAGANPENPGLASAPPANAPEAIETRAQALAASPRIPIDTPSLMGSIALKGARIDDLSLKDYRETPDPTSPNIVLLSPSGAPAPYYAEMGFVGEAGAKAGLPTSDTLWTADGDRLTPEKPLTLTYDNGQGLVFHRKISVDSNYMFTIEDSVDNKGTAPVTLYPYSLVARHGKPTVSGYAMLFEGMLGVIGDGGVQENNYDAIDKEPGATKVLKGTGGWIGFTDKYWATVVISDQQAPIQERFSSTGTTVKTYQTDVLYDAERSIRAPARS